MTASPPPPGFHVAGLVVSTAPAYATRVEAQVSAQPGFMVYARDHSTGRLVVTLETGSAHQQEAGFQWLSALSGVHAVNLVSHYIDP